ncbi:MAG: acyltransferase family protein [Myxococcota bacterium]
MSIASPTVPLRRYDGLDVVRAAAMLLGVCYHAAYSYVPDIGRWYFVTDVSSSSVFVTVVGVLHSFRMQLFFALSGFFAHLVLERRGERGFLVDRSRRLVVPFLAALPVTVFADVATRHWSRTAGVMSPDFAAQDGFRVLPMHLWFLEYLFLYCLAAWAATGVGLEGRSASRGLAKVLRVPEVLLVLGVPLGLALMRFEELRPAASFLPEPHSFLHYGLFFLLGWLLWPAREAVDALARRGAWMAVAGFGLAFFVHTRHLQWEPLGHFLAGVVPAAVTLGCLGLAFRVPPATRPTLRFLVESSYWVYLVHFPVVLALQVALATTPWPAVPKYLAVVAVTFAFAFATFRLVVYRSALGPWLGVKPPVAAAR